MPANRNFNIPIFKNIARFAHEADIREGKISVLAPVGTAVIGAREGETVEWNVPNGLRRLKIVKVTYQPEAAGNFHL